VPWWASAGAVGVPWRAGAGEDEEGGSGALETAAVRTYGDGRTVLGTVHTNNYYINYILMKYIYTFIIYIHI
jgi:hypothetical protein